MDKIMHDLVYLDYGIYDDLWYYKMLGPCRILSINSMWSNP